MIKKLYLFIILLMMCASTAMAHDSDKKSKEDMFRELQEFKVKFIAQEIDLKEDQRQRFIELYGEMNQKRLACMKEARALERKLKKNPGATEEDYQKVTDSMNQAKAEAAAIEKEYDDKFAEFLSQKQIFKMKSAENEFRKKMEEMRHNKKGKRK